MKKKEISQKIAKATLNIFATSIDLVLFTLLMCWEAGTHPMDAHSMGRLQKRYEKLFLQGKDRIIRNVLYQAKCRGWLEKDLKLTQEGRERIESSLPKVLSPKNWTGEWYLVIFDIPEKLRKKRNILRENLKKLGFGQLQASVWLSAINYLGKVEELVKFWKLEPYVIFSITEKLGKESSRVLSNKVWKLEKLNKEYLKFIKKWEKDSDEGKFWLRFKYLDILSRDPQLPKGLLPENWAGLKAHQLIRKYKDK